MYAAYTRPGRGPYPDGVLARLAHHRRLLRRRDAGADALHAVARPAPPRPAPPRATGPALGPREGRALRRRRGLRHQPELRDGPALARPDGEVRPGDRPAVHDRGVRVL